jgi:hypothetical protein
MDDSEHSRRAEVHTAFRENLDASPRNTLSSMVRADDQPHHRYPNTLTASGLLGTDIV